MANLTISASCNQTCAYCFTVDHLGNTRRNQLFLTLDGLKPRLDFLDRSNIDQVRLLGGEPTLHPQFLQLIEQIKARNKKIIIFSGGLMPAPVLDALAELEDTECAVLINVNEPSYENSSIIDQQRIALRRLGNKAQPGFNMVRSKCKPEFLLPLIAETGCKRSIRLGIAHPCISGANQFMHPNQYTTAGATVVRLAIAVAAVGVKVEFDCGFVRCMFTEQDLITLKVLDTKLAYHCSPILDIDLSDQVIHCYPLSRLGSLPLTDATTAADLRRSFESMTRSYRQAGIFRECYACRFKVSGECSGGCLAATMRRFRHTSFKCVLPHLEMGT